MPARALARASSIFSNFIAGLLILAVLQFLSGCSAQRYRESADRETYGIIKEKTPAVPGMSKDFSIETTGLNETVEKLIKESSKKEGADEFLGPNGSEAGTPMLSLERALHIAVLNSRTYQNRKESLYLVFLGLTLDRHDYTPIFSGGAKENLRGTVRDIQNPSEFSKSLDSTGKIIDQVEAITGTPANLLNQYAAVVGAAGALAGWDRPVNQTQRDQQLTTQTQLGVERLMRGGGQIAVGLAANFLRFVTGDSRISSNAALTASFTQPLWRGAGAKIAAERLTQAERDALYALRDFTRFRMDFTVTICSEYYNVLEAREVARNNWQSYVNFKKNVDRQREFYKESRDTLSSLGRLEQALLATENSWTNSVRTYRERLDQFKIALGLSTDVPFMLSPAELDGLRERGLQHPDITPEDAIKVALEARLDLYNSEDRANDAERHVALAKNALKPGLTFAANATVPNKGNSLAHGLDADHVTWDAGLDFQPGLDKKSNRNSYRASLIAFEQAKRSYSLSEDTIKLDVRGAWRTLDQARSNFEIAKKGVELNQRRVEEQDLLAELGRATALNQVDAQNDLTSSQNELIGALVNHTIARLQFWRDMGILYIKDNGQWEEVNDDRRK